MAFRRIRDAQGPNDNPQVENIDATGNATVAGTLAITGTSTFTGAISAVGGVTSTSGAGTVTTGATTVATELGDGINHVTKLTMTAFAVGTSGDNASLGIGAKFYTLPAGTMMVENASIVGGLTAAISNTAQTPEIGIGTVIASGAVAVLGGTATFENVFEGTAVADVAGTTFQGVDNPNGATSSPLLITSAGSHDLFLNVAVAWADVTAAGAVTFTGVITVKWRKIS